MADRERGKIKISALACSKCGAPMYPDMKQNGMSCLYCGNFHLFAETDADFTKGIRFRHQPVEVVDGLMKLGHVAIMEKAAPKPPPAAFEERRKAPVDEKIAARDAEAFAAMRDEAYFEMNCPHCGNPLKARLTDNIFSCPSCGQKFGDFDLLSTGDFDARLVVGRAYNLFGKCLPFRVSREDAAARAESLARRYGAELGGDPVGARARERLTAAYVPVQLADFRWKMEIKCEKGTFWYYQECLDWAWPRSLMYDMFLLDEVAPFDYAEMGILKPAYLEGNVRLIASENLGPWQAALPDWLLLRKTPERLRAAFGIENAEILQISRDLRKHQYGLLLLPIYFLDGDGAHTTRVMVNGQTGKAAALVQKSGTENILALEPSGTMRLSAERTMLSPPAPVRYVKQPFLHERLRFEDALEKPKGIGGFFSKLFG